MLFMVAVGIWGLFTFAKGGVLEGSISGALVIGQILILTQGTFGLVLYFFDDRPSDPVHILYGITAGIAMPFVYTYAKDRDARQSLLIFSLIALFIAGLAIRGMTTG
jgi:CDP-diglyceride synthetase